MFARCHLRRLAAAASPRGDWVPAGGFRPTRRSTVFPRGPCSESLRLHWRGHAFQKNISDTYIIAAPILNTILTNVTIVNFQGKHKEAEAMRSIPTKIAKGKSKMKGLTD